MLRDLKKRLYFFAATYFRFWATLRLQKWQPYIILVTGSNGKTTLLHLLESQIGEKARYSHFANSSFGIPFHILGIVRTTFRILEWPGLFFQAPFSIFKPIPREKIYVVEADSDRPGEAAFISTFIKPHVTLWLNANRSHAQNFDAQVASGKFATIDAAIKHEFGTFVENTQERAYVGEDLDDAVTHSKAEIISFKEKGWLEKYELNKHGTTFTLKGKIHQFANHLLPEDAWLSLAMCEELCKDLEIPYDYSYKHFKLPPGRSSLFEGQHNSTIIDSSYNATPDSMRAMLDLFEKFPGAKKWIVLGDMIQLGAEEKEEHEKLGKILKDQTYEQLILVGPRLGEYTYPLLDPKTVVTFDQPKDALTYLKAKLAGEETIFFKGSRFLEGIIEQLLAHKDDVAKLCRREAVWQRRRKQWGLSSS